MYLNEQLCPVLCSSARNRQAIQARTQDCQDKPRIRNSSTPFSLTIAPTLSSKHAPTSSFSLLGGVLSRSPSKKLLSKSPARIFATMPGSVGSAGLSACTQSTPDSTERNHGDGRPMATGRGGSLVLSSTHRLLGQGQRSQLSARRRISHDQCKAPPLCVELSQAGPQDLNSESELQLNLLGLCDTSPITMLMQCRQAATF